MAIFEEKKKADVSLWLYDTKQIREEIDEAEKTWKLSLHELEIAGQVLKELETQLDSLYNKSQSYKLKSAALLEQYPDILIYLLILISLSIYLVHIILILIFYHKTKTICNNSQFIILLLSLRRIRSSVDRAPVSGAGLSGVRFPPGALKYP